MNLGARPRGYAGESKESNYEANDIGEALGVALAFEVDFSCAAFRIKFEYDMLCMKAQTSIPNRCATRLYLSPREWKSQIRNANCVRAGGWPPLIAPRRF